MASHKALVSSGFLIVLITIVVQSAPVQKAEGTVQSSSTNNKQEDNQHLLKSVDSEKPLSISSDTTTSSTITVSQSSSSTPEIIDEKNDHKQKRYIDDDQLDGLSDEESDEVESPYFKFNNNNYKTDHILHAKIQETSAKIHDNADKPVDSDDSKVFSDFKMTPNELIDVARRRRDIKFNDESNRRRKRALSPYDFYNADSFYDPYDDLIEEHQYVRPSRSFAPLYWYPSVYERNIRSALASSFYESPPRLYSSNIDDDDEVPVSIFDDENNYESNRYPVLLQPSNSPYDNLQLQQQYNTDDLPIDEDVEQNLNDDDDDEEEQYNAFYQNERPYDTRYGPLETYF